MAEPSLRARRPHVDDPVRERAAWLQLLDDLIDNVRVWISAEWSTRRIERPVVDPTLGEYDLPGLLMQREFTKLLLEPITRFAPGTDGVVDLYLMPALNDIATLYHADGEWRLHYTFRGDPIVAGIKNGKALPLNQANFLKVVDSIASHAPQ